MTARIIVVGSLNMDVVCRVARAPAAGETVLGESASFVPGGKGANQAVACARLGAVVRMIGRVGPDAFGARLREGLSAEGIDVARVGVDTEATSGVALILVEADGQNRITVAAGANARLTPAHVVAAAADWPRGGLLLAQLETPLDTIAAAIEAAHEAGLRVVLNPAPAQPLPAAWWRRIDLLVPNETEAALLTGLPVGDVSGAISAARELRRRGVHHVLLTLAERGVLLADADGERVIPAPRVQVVDTTAAGDTFIGALAVALGEGLDLDAAAAFGVRAASLSVTRPGAQSSIPHRSEL
ncbi:MAG TPA: ribokinase [Steroidobacteraceae bacterium]|nr:ribokinase [Steroidobacteraceae bacterium]